jgi:hypothetical protein
MQGITTGASSSQNNVGSLHHNADPGRGGNHSVSNISTYASKKSPSSEDPNLTFRPEIRPSSRMRPAPTVDSLFEGKQAAKEAWLEAQRAAQEEAYRTAHPFKPALSPQPSSMAHVRGTLSISNPRFLEFHKRRQAERQALAQRQAKMREVCALLAPRLMLSATLFNWLNHDGCLHLQVCLELQRVSISKPIDSLCSC